VSTKHIFFKAICIALTVTFLVNDVSFAADEVRSCLAVPLLSKPIVGSENLDTKSPIILLWHLIAESQAKNLSKEQALGLINETLIKRIPDENLINRYNWRNLNKELRGGKDVFVLPFVDGGKLVFTQEAYDPHDHILKFDLPEGSVTVRAEGMNWKRSDTATPKEINPPEKLQPPVVEKSEDTTDTATRTNTIDRPQDNGNKPDQTKLEAISDKLKKLLGWLKERWDHLAKQIEHLRQSPTYNRSVFLGSACLSALTGAPLILAMPCDRMYYYRELEERMRREQIQNDREIEERVKEAEGNLKEMGEFLDDLSDTIADESRDEFDTEITDTEKHDIREITIQSVSRYVKSGKKDKNFEELVSILAKELQSKVFKHDSIEKVEAMLRKEGVSGDLKKIYDKAGQTLPLGQSGTEGGGSTISDMQKALLHNLQHMAKGLGILKHHHHLLIFALTTGLLGTYTVCRFAFGLHYDFLLYGAFGMVANMGIPGMPAQEEDPAEIIKKYTNDLDALASDRKIDDTYYLSSSVAMLNDQVANEACKNVFLVGDPVATQGLLEATIVRKASLTNLKNARFLEVNTARFIDNLAIPGQLESDLRKLTTAIKTVYKKERVVLVLNFQDFFDMYKMKGGTGASLYFQMIEAIEAKNISVAILSNPELYERKLSKERKLQDKFGVIDLKTLPEYDLKRIARNHVRRLNTLYKDILPEGINLNMSRQDTELALYLAQKYYPQGLPVNKFQEVLDRVITGVFTDGDRLNANLAEIRKKLLKAAQELQKAMERKAPAEETDFLELTIDKLLTQREEASKKIEENTKLLEKIKKDKRWEISLEDVAREIAEDTGIPLRDILAKEDDLLKEYVPRLKEMLIGQDAVIGETYKAFMRRVNIGEGKNKPIGAYLLVGPTGVGKTEFARSLAKHMFGAEDAMIRIDMSEYMNPIDAQKLIGSPPGYVGYEQGGILTEHVSRRPYSVVLLDEIEKANPAVFKLLLQVFEEGELRDGKGRIANFKNTIIIMTSNIGFSEPFRAAKEEEAAIDEVIKYIGEEIKLCNATISDPEWKKLVSMIKTTFEELKSCLAKHNLTDDDLEADLKEMSWILSDNPYDRAMLSDRQPFIARYLENIRKTLQVFKTTDVQKSYDYIARVKNLAKNPNEERKAAKEAEVFLRAGREIYRGLIYAAIQRNTPLNQDVFDAYAKINEILAIKNPREKVQAYVQYLRSNVRNKIIDSVKIIFSPELLNRIGLDNIISFDPLSKEDLEKILEIKIRGINILLKEEGFGPLTMDKVLIDKVLEEGYDIPNGARPLERALKRLVLAPLSDKILNRTLEKGKTVEAALVEGKIVFTQKDIEKKEAAIAHREVIKGVESESASDDKRLAEIMGITPLEPEGKTSQTGSPEELRRRYEIDIETQGDIPLVYVTDSSQIDSELAKIEQKLTIIENAIDQLGPMMQAARNDQQKQAIARQLSEAREAQEILRQAKEVLLTRKGGNAARAAELQKRFEDNVTQEDDKARSTLNDSFENLSIEALDGELEDFHPSFEGVSHIAEILKQKRRNYPLILEDSLLMQKAVVDSFAKDISDGTLRGFDNTRVLRLKLESLKDYFSLVGYFESRMKEIIDRIEEDDVRKGLKTVIVIDFDDIKNELERVRINPFMLGYFLRMFKALKTVSFVMTTSREAIQNDDSFDHFFSLVKIPGADKKDILENLYLFLKDHILKKSNGTNGAKYDISFDAMDMAVKIWSQYPMGRDPIETIRKWFTSLLNKKKQEDAQVSMGLRDSLSDLREELIDLAASGHIGEDNLALEPTVTGKIREINAYKEMVSREKTFTLGPKDLLGYVIKVEAAQSGVEIDEEFFSKDENAALINIEETLGRRVLNQPEAIEAASRVLKIAKAGLKNKKSPIGTFIFAGPTGVGKTQLAKTIAKERGMSLLRIDMSEYKNPEDLSRLIGATTGYVGYLDDMGEVNEGLLYTHMRDNPKTVLLFDEVEKAHPAVLNILLQIMEDGRFTSNQGNTVRFDKSIIILTTNLGMETLKIGDNDRVVKESLYPEMERVMRDTSPDRDKKIAEFKKKMEESVRASAKQFFRPEFLNRIDQIVVFSPLPIESLTDIVAIFLTESAESFKNKQGFDLVIGRTEEERRSIYHYLADKGYQPENGARPMEQAVKKYFEDSLVDYLVQRRSGLAKGDTVTAVFSDGKISFESSKGTTHVSVLPDEDRKVLQAIAAHLKDHPAEPVTVEDLEEIFGFRTEVAVGIGEKAAISGGVVELKNTDFLKKDPELTFLKEAGSMLISVKVKPYGNETPEDASKNVVALLNDWIRNAVRLSKMANLEAFIYENEKRVIDGFYDLRRDELEKQSAPYIGKTGDKKETRSVWEYKDGVVKVGLTFNSRLTRFLHRAIFAKEYKDDDDIGNNAPRSLQGVLKAKLAIEKLGGKMNFYSEEGKTILWMSLPVEEYRAPPKPAVEPESRPKTAKTYLLQKKPGVSTKESIRDMMKHFGLENYGEIYTVKGSQPAGLPMLDEGLFTKLDSVGIFRVERQAAEQLTSKVASFIYIPDEDKFVLCRTGQKDIECPADNVPFEVELMQGYVTFRVSQKVYDYFAMETGSEAFAQGMRSRIEVIGETERAGEKREMSSWIKSTMSSLGITEIGKYRMHKPPKDVEDVPSVTRGATRIYGACHRSFTFVPDCMTVTALMAMQEDENGLNCRVSRERKMYHLEYYPETGTIICGISRELYTYAQTGAICEVDAATETWDIKISDEAYNFFKQNVGEECLKWLKVYPGLKPTAALEETGGAKAPISAAAERQIPPEPTLYERLCAAALYTFRFGVGKICQEIMALPELQDVEQDKLSAFLGKSAREIKELSEAKNGDLICLVTEDSRDRIYEFREVFSADRYGLRMCISENMRGTGLDLYEGRCVNGDEEKPKKLQFKRAFILRNSEEIAALKRQAELRFAPVHAEFLDAMRKKQLGRLKAAMKKAEEHPLPAKFGDPFVSVVMTRPGYVITGSDYNALKAGDLVVFKKAISPTRTSTTHYMAQVISYEDGTLRFKPLGLYYENKKEFEKPSQKTPKQLSVKVAQIESLYRLRPDAFDVSKKSEEPVSAEKGLLNALVRALVKNRNLKKAAAVAKSDEIVEAMAAVESDTDGRSINKYWREFFGRNAETMFVWDSSKADAEVDKLDQLRPGDIIASIQTGRNQVFFHKIRSVNKGERLAKVNDIGTYSYRDVETGKRAFTPRIMDESKGYADVGFGAGERVFRIAGADRVAGGEKQTIEETLYSQFFAGVNAKSAKYAMEALRGVKTSLGKEILPFLGNNAGNNPEGKISLPEKGDIIAYRDTTVSSVKLIFYIVRKVDKDSGDITAVRFGAYDEERKPKIVFEPEKEESLTYNVVKNQEWYNLGKYKRVTLGNSLVAPRSEGTGAAAAPEAPAKIEDLIGLFRRVFNKPLDEGNEYEFLGDALSPGYAQYINYSGKAISIRCDVPESPKLTYYLTYDEENKLWSWKRHVGVNEPTTIESRGDDVYINAVFNSETGKIDLLMDERSYYRLAGETNFDYIFNRDFSFFNVKPVSAPRKQPTIQEMMQAYGPNITYGDYILARAPAKEPDAGDWLADIGFIFKEDSVTAYWHKKWEGSAGNIVACDKYRAFKFIPAERKITWFRSLSPGDSIDYTGEDVYFNIINPDIIEMNENAVKKFFGDAGGNMWDGSEPGYKATSIFDIDALETWASLQTPAVQPTIEEIMKKCGMTRYESWMLKDTTQAGVRITEEIAFRGDNIKIFEYKQGEEWGGDTHTFIYYPTEEKLQYTITPRSLGDKGTEYTYDKKDLYFDIEKTGDGRAIVKINESAYKYLKRKGANFSFEKMSFVTVSDEPGTAAAVPRKQPTLTKMAKAIGVSVNEVREGRQPKEVPVGNNEYFDVWPGFKSTDILGYIAVRSVTKEGDVSRKLTYTPRGDRRLRLQFFDSAMPRPVNLPKNVPFYFNVGKTADGKYYFEINKSAYNYFISQGCNLTFKNIETRVVPDEAGEAAPENETPPAGAPASDELLEGIIGTLLTQASAAIVPKPTAKVQAAAINALAEIGQPDDDVITTLCDASKEAVDVEVRKAAIEALGKLGKGNGEAVEALIDIVDAAATIGERELALKQIGDIAEGNPQAIQKLTQMVGNQSSGVESQVIKALGKIGKGYKKAIEELCKILNGSIMQVTSQSYLNAIRALGNIASKEDKNAVDVLTAIVLNGLGTDFDRIEAADSLDKIDPGNGVAEKMLRDFIGTQDQDEATIQAKLTLARCILRNQGNVSSIDPKSLLAILADKDEDPAVRKEAEQTLGAGVFGLVVPTLEILRDAMNNPAEKPELRIAAARLLHILKVDNEPATWRLIEIGLSGPDADVQDQLLAIEMLNEVSEILKPEQFDSIIEATIDNFIQWGRERREAALALIDKTMGDKIARGEYLRKLNTIVTNTDNTYKYPEMVYASRLLTLLLKNEVSAAEITAHRKAVNENFEKLRNEILRSFTKPVGEAKFDYAKALLECLISLKDISRLPVSQFLKRLAENLSQGAKINESLEPYAALAASALLEVVPDNTDAVDLLIEYLEKEWIGQISNTTELFKLECVSGLAKAGRAIAGSGQAKIGTVATPASDLTQISRELKKAVAVRDRAKISEIALRVRDLPYGSESDNWRKLLEVAGRKVKLKYLGLNEPYYLVKDDNIFCGGFIYLMGPSQAAVRFKIKDGSVEWPRPDEEVPLGIDGEYEVYAFIDETDEAYIDFLKTRLIDRDSGNEPVIDRDALRELANAVMTGKNDKAFTVLSEAVDTAVRDIQLIGGMRGTATTPRGTSVPVEKALSVPYLNILQPLCYMMVAIATSNSARKDDALSKLRSLANHEVALIKDMASKAIQEYENISQALNQPREQPLTSPYINQPPVPAIAAIMQSLGIQGCEWWKTRTHSVIRSYIKTEGGKNIKTSFRRNLEFTPDSMTVYVLKTVSELDPTSNTEKETGREIYYLRYFPEQKKLVYGSYGKEYDYAGPKTAEEKYESGGPITIGMIKIDPKTWDVVMFKDAGGGMFVGTDEVYRDIKKNAGDDWLNNFMMRPTQEIRKPSMTVPAIMQALGYGDYPIGAYPIYEAKPVKEGDWQISEIATFSEKHFQYQANKLRWYRPQEAGVSENILRSFIYEPSANAFTCYENGDVKGGYDGVDFTLEIDNSGNLPRFLIPAHIYKNLVDRGAEEILKSTHVYPMEEAPAKPQAVVQAAGSQVPAAPGYTTIDNIKKSLDLNSTTQVAARIPVDITPPAGAAPGSGVKRRYEINFVKTQGAVTVIVEELNINNSTERTWHFTYDPNSRQFSADSELGSNVVLTNDFTPYEGPDMFLNIERKGEEYYIKVTPAVYKHFKNQTDGGKLIEIFHITPDYALAGAAETSPAAPQPPRKQPSIAEMARNIGVDIVTARTQKPLGDNEDIDIGFVDGFVAIRHEVNGKWRLLTYKEQGIPFLFTDQQANNSASTPEWKLPVYFNIGVSKETGRHYFEINQSAYDALMKNNINLTFRNIDMRVVPDAPGNETQAERPTVDEVYKSFIQTYQGAILQENPVKWNIGLSTNTQEGIDYAPGLFFGIHYEWASVANGPLDRWCELNYEPSKNKITLKAIDDMLPKQPLSDSYSGDDLYFNLRYNRETQKMQVLINEAAYNRFTKFGRFADALRKFQIFTVVPVSEDESRKLNVSKTTRRKQPTIEEMMENCAISSTNSWELFRNDQKIEDIYYDRVDIAVREFNRNIAGSFRQLSYNPSKATVSYSATASYIKDKKDKGDYEAACAYFNIKKVDDTHAVIEINESAYWNLKGKGADLAFQNISIIIVPDTPDEEWDTFVVPAQTGSLDKPRGVAVDADGNIFVANEGNDTVVVFNPDGRSLNRNFGVNGVITKEIGGFDKPCHCAFNAFGTLLVTNQGNNTVSAIQKADNYTKRDPNVGAGGIITPSMHGCAVFMGIATDKFSNILLADVTRYGIPPKGFIEVRALTPDGRTPNTDFGTQGVISKIAEIMPDTVVTFLMDKEDRIYIRMDNGRSDTKYYSYKPFGKELNNSSTDLTMINKYDVSLETVRMAGSLKSEILISQEAGCMSGPQDVRIDKDGAFIVTNAGNNSISIIRLRPETRPEGLPMTPEEDGAKSFYSMFVIALNMTRIGGLNWEQPMREVCNAAKDLQPAFKRSILYAFAFGNAVQRGRRLTERPAFSNTTTTTRNNVICFFDDTESMGGGKFYRFGKDLTYTDTMVNVEEFLRINAETGEVKIIENETHGWMYNPQLAYFTKSDLETPAAEISRQFIYDLLPRNVVKPIPDTARSTLNIQRSTNLIPNPDYIETYYTATPEGIWAAKTIPQSVGKFDKPGKVWVTTSVGTILVLNEGNVVTQLSSDGAFEGTLRMTTEAIQQIESGNKDKDGNTFALDPKQQCVKVSKPSGEPNTDFGPGGVLSQKAGKFGSGMSGLAIGNDGSIIVSDQNANYLSMVKKVSEGPRATAAAERPYPEFLEGVDTMLDAALKGKDDVIPVLKKLHDDVDPKTSGPVKERLLKLFKKTVIAGDAGKLAGLHELIRKIYPSTEDGGSLKAFLQKHFKTINYDNADKKPSDIKRNSIVCEVLLINGGIREFRFGEWLNVRDPGTLVKVRFLGLTAKSGTGFSSVISESEFGLPLYLIMTPEEAEALKKEAAAPTGEPEKGITPEEMKTIYDSCVRTLTQLTQDDDREIKAAAAEELANVRPVSREDAARIVLTFMPPLGGTSRPEMTSIAENWMSSALNTQVSDKRIRLASIRRLKDLACAYHPDTWKDAINKGAFVAASYLYARLADIIAKRDLTAFRNLWIELGATLPGADTIQEIRKILTKNGRIVANEEGSPFTVANLQKGDIVCKEIFDTQRQEVTWLFGTVTSVRETSVTARPVTNVKNIVTLRQDGALEMREGIVEQWVTPFYVIGSGMTAEKTAGETSSEPIKMAENTFQAFEDAVKDGFKGVTAQGFNYSPQDLYSLVFVRGNINRDELAENQEILRRAYRDLMESDRDLRAGMFLKFTQSISTSGVIRVLASRVSPNMNIIELEFLGMEGTGEFGNRSDYKFSKNSITIEIKGYPQPTPQASETGKKPKSARREPKEPPDDGGQLGPNVRRYSDGHELIRSTEDEAKRAKRLTVKSKKTFAEVRPQMLKDLGKACDEFKADKPQSLILFADDILKNAILYDFEDTLKLLKEKNVLAGGKIVLYVKDKEMEQKTEGLKALIENNLGASAEVVVIKQWERGQLNSCGDPVKEIEALVRISTSRGAKEILGVIRGNGIDWAQTFKDYNLQVPLVIINDNVAGIFSFSQAILLAMKAKAAVKDLSNRTFNAWIACLDPIEILTVKMYQDYIRYRDEVLVKA